MFIIFYIQLGETEIVALKDANVFKSDLFHIRKATELYSE